MNNKNLIAMLGMFFAQFQINAFHSEEPIMTLSEIRNPKVQNTVVPEAAKVASGMRVAHEDTNSTIFRNISNPVVKVDIDSGAIKKIYQDIGSPEDVTIALSSALKAKGLKVLDYNETSALANAIKAVKKNNNIPDSDQKPFIDDLNHVLRGILSGRKTSLSLAELQAILTKKNGSSLNALKVLASHAITNLTKSKINPAELATKNIDHKIIQLSDSENTQRTQALSYMSSLQENPAMGFEPALPENSSTGSLRENSVSSDPGNVVEKREEDLSTTLVKKPDVVEGNVASVPQMQIDISRSIGYGVDKQGAKKVIFDISSTTSGFIKNINSSADPVSIAQSISDILVASSKSGNPVAPFSASEVASLGSYIQQIREESLSTTAQNIVLGKAGVKKISAEDRSDNFNGYLYKLLQDRHANLSEAQLLEAIEKAESQTVSRVQALANKAKMAVASTPEYDLPSSGTITFTAPTSILPKALQGLSSDIRDFKRFNTSLQSQLDSMNSSDAKALIIKLLGNIDTSLSDPLMHRMFNGEKTIDPELTNLDFFDTQLSQNEDLKYLDPETVSKINIFLKNISSDPYHPLVLTDKNYKQVQSGLISMFRDVFKPILRESLGIESVDQSSVSTIDTRIMNGQLETYPKQINKLLSKQLGNDVNLLKKASDDIRVQFEYLSDSFKQHRYPTQDIAIVNMKVLLANPDGTRLTQEDLTADMKYLYEFLEKPEFNEDYEMLVNDLLQNMKSDIRLTLENYKAVSTSLSSFKSILEIALYDPKTAPKSLFTKVKGASSQEAAALKFIQDAVGQKADRSQISTSLPRSQQEIIRLQDTIQIISKGIQVVKGSSPSIQKLQAQEKSVAAINLLVTDAEVGIYDLSNSDAEAQLVSDIRTLQDFLINPTFTQDDKASQIINNILRNVKSDVRISSENYKDISIRLASLKPVLKIALDGLKVPLSAPKPEPTLAFVKPAPELKASVEPAKVVQEKPEDFAAQRNALIKSFEEKASAARAAQEASGSEQNSANEAIQVRSLAAKSKEFATNITSPDAAITTLNDLLAVEGKKYNLSDAQEKSLLISDLENLQHFLEDPNNNEQNQALINRLLKKMQSSLTLTSDNCKRISNSLVSLKEIAQKALNKLQTPAPATWGSYFGLNV